MNVNKPLTYLVISMLILLLAACEAAEGELPGDGDELTPTVAPGLPAEPVLDAQAWLAERLDVPVEQVEIVETEQAEWSDSCLGLGRLNESCLTVITPGWRAIFEVNGETYEVRTDETGDVIRSPQFNEPEFPDVPGDESSLANTQWQLISFGPVGNETPVVAGSTPTLEFDATGQAGGNSGCNTFGADYQVQDNMISFGEIVTTEIACLEEGVMDQEQQYYQALQSAGTFELTGNTLTIWYDDGQSVLNFARA
ncbi:MAG TPA: META domain-containing protein [Anaerolineae bacterium]